MRPLRLRIHGFTCFREEQEIDFSGLDLFAIAGPTGAGKTSILDAMVFALYGEVPRMGAQRLGELISLGLDRASAVLDFEVGAVSYRVMRKIRRHGAAQTWLERLAGGAWHPLADTVRGVEHEVKKLLGIDAGTFLKAVVLPQGQFADFLKSKPGPRRGMLRTLLQLDVYERMRERANQLARGAAQTAESLRGRLEDDFGDATPERLESIERRLGETVTEIHDAAEAAERARGRLEALDRTARLRRELVDARARLSELEILRALIETDEQRARRSERARPLLAILDAADAARTRHRSAAEDVAKLAPRAGAAQARFRTAGEQLQGAQAAAAEIGDLNAALVRLDQVQPLLARRTGCQRRAAQAEARRVGAEQELEAGRREIDECTQQAALDLAKLNDLDHELRHTGHDPDRLKRLSDALGPAASLVARHRDHARARGKLAMLDGKLAAAAVALTAAQGAAEHTAEAARQADARHDRAGSLLDAVRRAHAAHDLRATVAPGAPCPVCLQIVASVPSGDAPDELEAADREQRAASEEQAHRACAAHDARLALELAERAAADARVSRDEAAGELAGIAAEVEALAGQLVQLVGDIATGDAPAMGEGVPRLHEAARARAESHDRLEKRRADLASKIATTRHRQAMAEQRADVAERDRERATLDAGEAASELATLDAQIRITVPSGDPEHDRKRIVERIGALTKAHDEAVRAAQAARVEHDAAAQELAIAEAASATAASEDAAAQARAAAALRGAGFATAEAVRTAVLSDKQREDIERRARTWRSDHAVAVTRATDLEQQAGSEDIDATALASAQREADAACDGHGKLLAEQGRLGGERGDLQTRIARATALRDQLARARTEHAIYDQLAADLKTDQFQAYLLEGTFREIVQGASVRLRELSSGRYTLDYAQDDFFVVDHDNARERRRADTLSGGETFLASLALALQLSEQVQRAAGAVRLDSLFIDEGFGTLDPETLATVSDAIQQLGRGHRMVGIITHVQDLTSALPARIDVVRGPDGSKVKIISET
jgi:exonuclease SbcC